MMEQGDILVINGKKYFCRLYRGRFTPKQMGYKIHSEMSKEIVVEMGNKYKFNSYLYFEEFKNK